MELEVRVFRRQFLEIVRVEKSLLGTGAVPITDLAGGFLVLEEVGNVSPQGSHAGAAANVNQLLAGRFDVEIPEKADGGHGIARFEAEDVAGTDPGGQSCPGGGVAMRTLNLNWRSVRRLLAIE